MRETTIRLNVPAEPAYARSVRMMAANLAVVCGMSVDDVEDVRMAAEEGFVYSCATKPDSCDIAFSLSDGRVGMRLALGDAGPGFVSDADGDGELDMSWLVLGAVCDSCAISEDGSELVLVKQMGGADGN